jgi:UDP-N-acetylglucosamine diphosphorylase/glucosamine-1-phosphate N-acetyltransferase
MKKAVLLAAGDSTRMLPLSANLPKHLLPVAGKPLLFHTLEALEKTGIKETLIVYGYLAEKLSDAVNSETWGSGKMAVSFILQKERRGTAHAAGHARAFVGEDSSLLMNGDIIVGPGDLEGLIEYHEKGGFEMTLTVQPIDDPSAYGVVAVNEGRAVRLIEKPTRDKMISNLVNVGLYAIGPSLWDAIERTKLSPRGEYEITDSIGMLIENGNVGAYSLQTWWLDVGKPWDLLKANQQILSQSSGRIEGIVEEGAVIKDNCIIEPGAVVKSGAYIEGPAYIGKNAVVGPNCYIRPYTSLGKKVKIGNAVEIKNSIIMDNTHIGHLSYVGDSIVGRECNLGAGTITANLRHDNQAVRSSLKGKRVSSERRKLGAIIGDNVKTGIGTSIAPGIVMHQGSRTGIGVIVERDIGPNTMVIAKQNQTSIELESPK